MRVVAAVGGNAIGSGSPQDQRRALRHASRQLAELVAAGHQLLLTHGNGPQVGALLVQQRLARQEVVAQPLDVLGAQTQGQLGYLLQQELGAALRARGLGRSVVTVVTQVVVDADDPAFSAPDKPVGPHYTATELEHRADRRIGTEPFVQLDGVSYRRLEGGTWRRVVPSPPPLDVVEAAPVRALLDAGSVPICGGGGGVPVGHDGRGLEAVVDKDRTAALLCRLVDADALLILTDVDRVALDFGTPRQRWLDQLDAGDARRLLADGQFPPGSMGPKVAAAAEVAERGGRAVIASLERAADALAGRAGTLVTTQ